ncbi:ABC transporter permease subunit [Candidatus Bealeia paramacronuclearis]|uniref:ABC transporter permease subunit n=1 Tax=Candidatus Bealeia paramacronuclearis TaxID=1921001 RepID=A0ABZ2C1U7_9PROT|nr:ABC transporter permease subunit [Candidatus Bealeia paramacronuclearis]
MIQFRASRTFYDLRRLPSQWDVVALIVVIIGLTLFIAGSHEMAVPFTGEKSLPLSLDPINLPDYALQTILRMLFALLLSLLFSFVYASLAAKTKLGVRIFIPLLDVLQSVPILGFLSITVTGFIALFPGNLLGLECAAIFAIFTSQAWNMTFSLYQSFISVPKELIEVATLNRLSPWRRYWRLEVPYAVPQLLWNTMMSVSGGWFFVVASESITVSGNTLMLPGIGSYIAMASKEGSLISIFYAILTMFIVIILYNQILFRPLLAWSDKFKAELTASQNIPSSWVLTMIRRARIFHVFNQIWFGFLGALDVVFQGLSLKISHLEKSHIQPYNFFRKLIAILFLLCTIILGVHYALQSYSYIFSEISFEEIQHVTFLTLITLVRVAILCVMASLIWVPIGVIIGLNGPLASRLQPWVQFLAAFPANLFFPIFVIFIVKFQLNHDIWLSPLMILGTQWYILFNVIGGASTIPFDFQELTKNFNVKGWLQWKKLYLPGIAPAYVTGLLTAVGGSWNASIVAEYVTWGDKTLEANGVGAYIAASTAAGDQTRILLGVVILTCFVLVLNRVLWRRLYLFVTTRYRLD